MARMFVMIVLFNLGSSRPIANDSDKFYEINLIESDASRYVWPDFFGNAEPATDEKFQSNMSSEHLEFVMQNHLDVERPLALFEPPHTAVIQMDFASADEQFGFIGEAFVAQLGPNAPTPLEQGVVGQNIVRVNVNNGTINEFITLKEPSTGFKPTDVVFHQEDESDNTTLYIMDWGNILPPTVPNTGIVWKITHTGDSTSATAAAVSEMETLTN